MQDLLYGWVDGWMELLFCPSSGTSVGGAEVFGACGASMMMTPAPELGGAISVVSVVPTGGLEEAPPHSCSCSHNSRLSMIRCLSSAFLHLV